jgi:hypothetical protein
MIKPNAKKRRINNPTSDDNLNQHAKFLDRIYRIQQDENLLELIGG